VPLCVLASEALFEKLMEYIRKLQRQANKVRAS
jgi:hypothetical protein